MHIQYTYCNVFFRVRVSAKALCESLWLSSLLLVRRCNIPLASIRIFVYLSSPLTPPSSGFLLLGPFWPSCFTKCNDWADVKRILSGQFTTELTIKRIKGKPISSSPSSVKHRINSSVLVRSHYYRGMESILIAL